MSAVDFTNEDAIAGVTARAPRRSYQVALADGGLATIERWLEGETVSWSLSRGSVLSIDLGARDAEHPASNSRAAGSAPAIAPIQFDLGEWVHSSIGFKMDFEDGAANRWRALIVDHHLFSRPELLLRSWHRSEQLPSPPLDADSAAALQELHLFYAALVSPPRSGRPSFLSVLRCKACRDEEAAPQGARAIEPAGRRGTTPRLARVWTPPAPPKDCPHVPVARAALAAVCEAFPELAFELIGCIEPDSARARDRTPRRFVLVSRVLESALSHWLLGRAPDRGYGSYYGSYRRRGRDLRTYQGARVRSLRTLDNGAQVQSAIRAAVDFAAAAWEIAGSAEELSRSPAIPEGAVALPPPRLDGAIDPFERIDVPILVPEAPLSRAVAGPGTPPRKSKPRRK